jgi:hypothetical protein
MPMTTLTVGPRLEFLTELERIQEDSRIITDDERLAAIRSAIRAYSLKRGVLLKRAERPLAAP